MPKVLIGMKGPNAFADTARAVGIMTGLQHMSQRPLDSDVVPFDRAAGARLPAVLISGLTPVFTESDRINYSDYPYTSFKELSKYARFPQGMPEGIKLSDLKPIGEPELK